MNDWTSGYVADIDYTHGFYTELTPLFLSLAATARNVRGPDISGRIAYCELGCGHGFSANLLAAANPNVEFHATDFNPAHIAGARTLARETGVPNLHFYEDSFAEFLERPELPQFDIIALHGIYSWVAAEHRHTIVEFLRRKLKPGGLVYISYNAQPGWSAAAPMRHLMYLHGRVQGGPTIARLDPALDFIGRAIDAQGKYFLANPAVKARWENIKGQNRNYLAHEYLNDAWTLLYHSDVVSELSAAKLTFVGSGALLEHVDPINLTSDQQKLMGEVKDPVLRETLRDYITNQQFRRDVFVKGVTPLPVSALRQAWTDLRLTLAVPRQHITMKVKGALGDADLHEAVYKPLFDALANGPRTLREMFANRTIADLGWARIQEALLIVIGSGQVLPCLPAQGDGKRAKTTKPFNQAVLERARDNADLVFMASPVTGGGIGVGRFSQLFLLAMQNGQKTPESWAQFAWGILREQGQLLMKEGKALETAEENLAELTSQAKTFEERQLPILKTLLVV